MNNNVSEESLGRILSFISNASLQLDIPSFTHYLLSTLQWSDNLFNLFLETEMGILAEWMVFLKDEGYTFEQKLGFGRTPLLDYAYKDTAISLEKCRLLLEYGANIHATDHWRDSALHLALIGSGNGTDSKILVEKLDMLIKAGVDVRCCNNYGETPSYYARTFQCWNEWCMALEANGFNSEAVEGIDMERDAVG